MTSPTISVVICAYTLDRWELILDAIRSVREQQPAPAELIVVTDHNAALAERLRSALPDLTVVPNENRAGLSGARNQGTAAATGTVVAFLDDDAAAEPGWLAELARAYDDPSVHGAGGWIEPRWVAGRPAWFPAEFDWVVGCTYRGQPTAPAFVRNPIGANMSFLRSAIDAAGGFHDGLGRIGDVPVGGEETELCIRIVQRDPGARFAFRPEARVRHTVPAARGTVRYFVRRCFAEGRSKAAITVLVGRAAGLDSERRYAARTLPAGVVRGLAATARGDLAGLGRAAMIVVGLLVTTAGYAMGTIGLRIRPGGRPRSAPSGLESS